MKRWLGELALALREESYRPDPIRRVFIPNVGASAFSIIAGNPRLFQLKGKELPPVDVRRLRFMPSVVELDADAGFDFRPDGKMPAMTRADLIELLASRFPGLVAKDSEISVKLILEAIGDALVRGNRVEVRGFGSFSLSYRSARTGRNPKSGNAVMVPAKYVPHFTVGKELRERVEEAVKHTPLPPASLDVVKG